ncbi:MAG TPA: serine hydrolase domain-containing protein [Vicinamibacterales bacterium]
MRRIALGLGIATLLVVAPVQAADDLLLDRFRDYVDALRGQAGIPGLAATLVGRSDVLWEHASGLQDVERSIAARPDTPFNIDGLTQLFTTAVVLRCAEEGRLSLDDQVDIYKSGTAEPSATLRQLLTNTSGPPDALSFTYQPSRLEPMGTVIRKCTDDSYRETFAKLFERFAMVDSVPGADAVTIKPPTEGIPTAEEKARYADVLARLAPGYVVDRRGRATLSARGDSPLTAFGGIVSTVRDLARFDLALRTGVMLRDETLAAAWSPQLGRDRSPLPYGMGWFVQSYNGERVVWQFGQTENASSSLMITLPGRGLTLILLANSDGLTKALPLSAGDVSVSPFARVFLGLFAR